MTISEPYAAELGRQVDELEAENAELRERLKRTLRNLCGRDDFIVSKRLWSEFVDTLPRS